MYGCDQAWDGKVNNSSEYATAGNYVYSILSLILMEKKGF